MSAEYHFKGINWGADDGKDDTDLAKYFVEIPEYKETLTGDKRYIIGRKGTGKSAILEKIKIDSEGNSLIQLSSLSLKDFPLALLRSLRDKSYRDKTQYVPAWSFLIFIEIANMIILDQSSGPYQMVDDLKKFLKLNGFLGVSFTNTVTKLEQNDSKLSILPGFLNLDNNSTHSSSTTGTIHFQKVVKELEKLLCNINFESKYFILFDELDEGWRSGDANIRLLLLALLRSIENISLIFKKHLKDIVLVAALRSDIFDSLEDSDLNKLDDFILRLNWTGENTAKRFSLKDIVNKRITATFSDIGNNPWSIVVDDSDGTLPSRVDTVWKYMINRTYERPRDIIKFLKICQRISSGGSLKYYTVDKAELDYSSWLYSEIRDEIHSRLPIWKEVLQCLSRIGRGRFPLKIFSDELDKDQIITTYMQSEKQTHQDLAEILFDYSIIGNCDSFGKWLFRYKDHTIPFDMKKDIIVHYGMQKKLRIFR